MYYVETAPIFQFETVVIKAFLSLSDFFLISRSKFTLYFLYFTKRTIFDNFYLTSSKFQSLLIKIKRKTLCFLTFYFIITFIIKRKMSFLLKKIVLINTIETNKLGSKYTGTFINNNCFGTSAVF